jgi:hypothetical protein
MTSLPMPACLPGAEHHFIDQPGRQQQRIAGEFHHWLGWHDHRLVQ